MATVPRSTHRCAPARFDDRTPSRAAHGPAAGPPGGGAAVRRLPAAVHRLLAATLACAVMAIPGCSSDGGPTDPPPSSGTYRVEVASPNGSEGGAVFSMPALGVAATTALEGGLYSRETGDRIRIVLLRSDPGPLAFRLELDGEGPVPEIELLQVASPDNALRDLAGYSVETTRE